MKQVIGKLPNFNPYNAAVFSFCSLRNNEEYSYIIHYFQDLPFLPKYSPFNTIFSPISMCSMTVKEFNINFRVILFSFMSTQLTINNHIELWILCSINQFIVYPSHHERSLQLFGWIQSHMVTRRKVTYE